MTNLRTKARLLVPEGAMLVGVLDEFNVLREGEVFVQVRQRVSGQATWLVATQWHVAGVRLSCSMDSKHATCMSWPALQPPLRL